MSSSSSSSTTLGQPFCFCNVEATLKFSNTTKNPGRPFLGCPNYNTKGLPYCKFFKWVDGNQENELKFRERTKELLRKEREVEKRLDDVKKRELLLVVREAEMSRERRLLRLYWVFAFVVACCIGLRT